MGRSVKHVPKKFESVGLNDPDVSDYLKIWITQGSRVVCGYIGEGTTEEHQSNWDSPFEQDTAASFADKGANIGQVLSKKTSYTTLNSTQVWNGDRPVSFSIIMNLYALSDAKSEVMDAITALKEFKAPDVKANFPIGHESGQGTFSGLNLGRIPSSVSVNIGRNFLYPDMIIESLTIPHDGVRNKDGYLMDAEISMQVQTQSMLNVDEMKGLVQ